jgi:hypothetical protein
MRIPARGKEFRLHHGYMLDASEGNGDGLGPESVRVALGLHAPRQFLALAEIFEMLGGWTRR